MPKTPKERIKYITVGKPAIHKAVILDAGFRRRIDKDTNTDMGPYISLAIVTDKGESHIARLSLTGGALPITKRTLLQLGADIRPQTVAVAEDSEEKRGPGERLAESLRGKECVITVMAQQAIDEETGGPAVDDKGKALVAGDQVNLRANDFETGDEVSDLLNAPEAEEEV
jgi:hypothetical protein